MTWPGLAEAFGHGFMQHALLGGLMVAVVCALIGVFTVLRGLSLLSDGLAHVSFAGIALGLVLNIFPLGLALAAAVLGAVGIQILRERGWAKGDVAIGLFFTAGLALGIALVSRGRGLNVSVSGYLFGSILTVTGRDLQWVLALGLVLVLLIAAFYKELLYVAFNEEAARVSGLPVRAIGFGASALTGATVVLAARIVGVLLVSALIIVPAAAALHLARSFRGTLAAAAVLGMLAVAVGLYSSYAWDVAAGASIALASLGLYVVVFLARRAVPGRA